MKVLGLLSLLPKQCFPSAKLECAQTREIKSIPFLLTSWQLYRGQVMRLFAPNSMQNKCDGVLMSQTHRTVFYTELGLYQKPAQCNTRHILFGFSVDDLSRWLVWKAIWFPPLLLPTEIVTIYSTPFWHRQAKPNITCVLKPKDSMNLLSSSFQIILGNTKGFFYAKFVIYLLGLGFSFYLHAFLQL